MQAESLYMEVFVQSTHLNSTKAILGNGIMYINNGKKWIVFFYYFTTIFNPHL